MIGNGRQASPMFDSRLEQRAFVVQAAPRRAGRTALAAGSGFVGEIPGGLFVEARRCDPTLRVDVRHELDPALGVCELPVTGLQPTDSQLVLGKRGFEAELPPLEPRDDLIEFGKRMLERRLVGLGGGGLRFDFLLGHGEETACFSWMYETQDTELGMPSELRAAQRRRLDRADRDAVGKRRRQSVARSELVDGRRQPALAAG